ncbi:heparinase II/III family protein [Motiliproteus coralliicola]|nr:heparinase II/III family protein [Motiliproteus coralliicola]
MISPGKFTFLNVTHEIQDADWDQPSWPKLWRYNLHYFDDLNAVGSNERKAWHQLTLENWIQDNPPGQGTGWEPYPTSLRIVNWIKWSLIGNPLSFQQRQSLAIQVRWLHGRLERHILGNHLLANAKALVFAGVFFEGEEAQHWLNTGLRILGEQLDEQILADGGHFELSPMYQSIVIEDLLDLVHLSSIYEEDLPVNNWVALLPKMIGWLRVMTHPDGRISFFNDAALKVAADIAVLEKYAASLNIKIVPTAMAPYLLLKDSGYLRSTLGPAVMLVDIAPVGPSYLPAHGHADTLSFELSLFGRRLLVNSGTSCYGIGSERERQRGTAAHNTLLVDNSDSSEVWAGFRVGRRAEPKLLELAYVPNSQSVDALTVRGSHNGYMYLSGQPEHQRSWQLSASDLLISDTVHGDVDSAQARYHLHPDWIVEMNGNLGVIKECDQIVVEIEVLRGRPHLESGLYHPEFGVSIPNQCLCVDADNNGQAEIIFRWQS